jgi:hypothetical protein
MRVRSQNGGSGKIENYPHGSADTKDLSTSPVEIKAGDWQEVAVPFGNPGLLGTLRVYLPTPVEIDFIEVVPAKSKAMRWDF